LCLFYFGDAIYPKLISYRAMLNVSAISPYTGLQNWWSLVRWKQGLKELLKINFSSILHLWTCVQT
jgi:flagellar biosynthesis protein FlhB